MSNLKNNKPKKSFEECSKDGLAFEKFAVRRFSPSHFELIEWRSDKRIDSIMPLSSKNPDLVFRVKQNKRKYFAVECKYKSVTDSAILFEPEKINHYMAYGERMRLSVYLLVGRGNIPNNPKELFFIPLEIILKNRMMNAETLRKFQLVSASDYFIWDLHSDELCYCKKAIFIQK